MDYSCSAERARKQKDSLKSKTNVQSLGLASILENGQTNPKVGVMCWDGDEREWEEMNGSFTQMK